MLELFSLSLFVSLHSHGSAPPLLLLLVLLLPPPSCSEAPLLHTLHSPPPPSSPPPPLPLAPSACLPSLLPGGPGQCWRRSRDLQEICLSEKQLVRLSTANVCMLGLLPPLPLGGARARPGRGTFSVFSACLLLFSFHLELSLCFHSPSDDPVLSDSIFPTNGAECMFILTVQLYCKYSNVCNCIYYSLQFGNFSRRCQVCELVPSKLH